MKSKSLFVLVTIALIALLFAGCGNITRNDILISEKNTSEFRSVDITTSFSEIKFVSSDRYGFEILVPGSFDPEWDITNGRLTIRENTNRMIVSLNVFSPRYSVKVYYPAGNDFNDISLRSASGRIELPQMDVKNLDIRSSSGRIDAVAEGSVKVSIETSSGGISFSGSGGNVDIESSSGNVRSVITDCESVNVTTSSGNVNLTGKGDSATALTVNTMSGRIDINGIAWRDITARSSSGTITINGELLGITSVDSSSGSVNISVHGNPSQYGYTLTPNSGSIFWNGERMASPALSSGAFDNHIMVDTASGSIRVSFTKN